MAEKLAVSRKVAALLRRVEKRILEEPRRLDMERWGVRLNDEQKEDLGKKAPPCGTTACIAGFIAIDGMSMAAVNRMSNRKFNGLMRRAENIAFKALGQPHDPETYGTKLDRLFVSNYWPEPYASRYANAATPSTKARVAVRRIEHYIKTGQ